MDSNNMYQTTQQTQPQSGLGIAGMVLGIISIITACFIFGGFIGIAGLVLSIIGITQKNKKRGMSIAGIVLNVIAIIIMIIMFIAVGVSGEDTHSSKQTISSQDTTIPTVSASLEMPSDETFVDESTPEPHTDEAPVATLPTVGDTIEGEVWKISLLDAKEYDKIEDEYFNDVPQDGYKYLVLFFEVENVSNEDDYFNYFYIESYLDSYSTDLKIIINKPDGYDTLTGDVSAGKKMKGCLTYEVPASGWSELEVSYKNWIGASGKVATFVVTPDVVSQ